jgi:hypothetical protein
MRTTIDLPTPLFRRIKAKAALEGTSLKRLITHYVERGLNDGDTAMLATKPVRSAIPLIRPATGTPLPALRNADIHDILDQEDAEHARRS